MRISTVETASRHREAPAAVARSPTKPFTFTVRFSSRIAAMAVSTRACVRPLMTTLAPSRASARDGKPDAGGRARHQRFFIFEVQVHSVDGHAGAHQHPAVTHQ